MQTPTDEEIAALLATHGPKRPPAYAALTPCLDLVRALRHRRASFETVRQVLRARGVEVSETTIRNFARDILGEALTQPRPTLRRHRRPAPLPPPSEPRTEPGPPLPPAPVLGPEPRARGPRIANLKRILPDQP